MSRPSPDLPPASHPPPHAPRAARRSRSLILAWSLYLLAATLVSAAAAGAHAAIDVDTPRVAARLVLLLSAIGLVVLWPMLRLSQSPPCRPRALIAADLVLLLVPLQVFIWPHALITRWPMEVIAAVSLVLAAWALVVGAVLLVALRPDPARQLRRPALWLGLCLLLLIPGPVVVLLSGATIVPGEPPPLARVALTSSPLTAAYELTRDRPWSGRPARVAATHWWTIAATWAAAGTAWILSWRFASTPSSRTSVLHGSVGGPGAADRAPEGGAAWT